MCRVWTGAGKVVARVATIFRAALLWRGSRRNRHPFDGEPMSDAMITVIIKTHCVIPFAPNTGCADKP